MAKPSKQAVDMIVAFEVTSEAVYTRKYQRPEWPGGMSGVTIGIGYDVGYVSAVRLSSDWKGRIPDEMIAALGVAVGVKGPAAQALASELHATVIVPWQAANDVFMNRDMPSYADEVRAALPHADELSDDSFGALVSLTYNRGASYAKAGDRYIEMRAIKSDMAARNFAAIPAEILAMQRLWPTVAGLRDRRRREARLFKDGLA